MSGHRSRTCCFQKLLIVWLPESLPSAPNWYSTWVMSLHTQWVETLWACLCWTYSLGERAHCSDPLNQCSDPLLNKQLHLKPFSRNGSVPVLVCNIQAFWMSGMICSPCSCSAHRSNYTTAYGPQSAPTTWMHFFGRVDPLWCFFFFISCF